jgi:TatD DNase family protein
VVAVGETGMDYYWPGKLEGCAEIEEQIEAFRWHIDLAKRIGKPLMIHNREADHDLLTVLLDEGAPDAVIFHCFSSDANMALACVDQGYVLSFSGSVSFRNARELHEAAKVVPEAQILVETDAPFLTPHPYRGAPNESYCLPYTVRALAALREQDPTELAQACTANAERIYRLPS